MIGARIAPAKNAPMPTSAKDPTMSAAGPANGWTRCATDPPSVAPMKSDGAKMPPDSPHPYDVTVAASLPALSSAIRGSDSWPSSAADNVG